MTVAQLVPQTVRLSRDEQAPADGLEMTFPLVGLPAVAHVELSDETGVLFAGIVDEQNETYTQEEQETELVCRSFEALLLDNPAYAGTMRNPSRAVLEYGPAASAGACLRGWAGRCVSRRLYGRKWHQRLYGGSGFFPPLRHGVRFGCPTQKPFRSTGGRLKPGI